MIIQNDPILSMIRVSRAVRALELGLGLDNKEFVKPNHVSYFDM